MVWDLCEDLLSRSLLSFHQYSSIEIVNPEASPQLFQCLKQGSKNRLKIIQPFKPYYNEFNLKGFQVSPEYHFEDKNDRKLNSLSIWVPTQQKVESLGVLARILKNHSGEVLFICENDLGAKSYAKILQKLFPCLNLESESKCKWGLWNIKTEEKSGDYCSLLSQLEKDCQKTKIGQTQYWGVPGIYGWNKIDQGSSLLLENLPTLSGQVMDLGSGYGYLSGEILKNSRHNAERVYLFEADFRALEMSQLNLESFVGRAEFHWVDIVGEGLEKWQAMADFVLMNPPFHEGAEKDISVGMGFIEKAARLLKKSGRLFMVANVFLPYEKTLERNFRTWKKLPTLSKSFKIFEAQK